MSHDYSAFAEDAPNAEAITGVGKIANQLYDAECEVARIEHQLKRAKARVRDIQERDLPAMMEEAGIAEMTLANGGKLSVKKVMTVRPPAANRPAVLQWLESTGDGGKIKRSVTVVVGKDQDRSEALLKDLAEEGYKDVKVEAWVEPATLKKHVNDRLAAGEEVDADLVGLYEYKKAEIKGAPAPVFEDE